MTTETELRHRLQHQRAQVARLGGTINKHTAHYLHQELDLATSVLDIVEHSISAKVLAEPRLPGALARWLSQTSNLLKTAEAQTAYVAEIIAKFGPDVVTLG
jgi:hypothetical protein